MKKNIFNYFQNHGNESGTDDFTICFGDPNEEDHVITGAEDTEADAIEACKRLNSIIEKMDNLQAFKTYVHKRLDDMGVPTDPEPEKNAMHGCRIEGRLNSVEKILFPDGPNKETVARAAAKDSLI